MAEDLLAGFPVVVEQAVGWGDMGVIRIGRVDADVEALYNSVGPLVFG